jgi:hypothetical protein
LFEAGDPYFHPNLSPHSPNWQVADPLEFKLDIRRRIFKREPRPSQSNRGAPAVLNLSPALADPPSAIPVFLQAKM